MKIMIASDIHGSAFYCEKMIEAYREREKQISCCFWGTSYITDREMICQKNTIQRK